MRRVSGRGGEARGGAILLPVRTAQRVRIWTVFCRCRIVNTADIRVVVLRKVVIRTKVISTSLLQLGFAVLQNVNSSAIRVLRTSGSVVRFRSPTLGTLRKVVWYFLLQPI